MRARCEIKGCSNSDIATKVCEEFEAVIYHVCWFCGDKIKEKLTYEQLETFEFVIGIIEKELA